MGDERHLLLKMSSSRKVNEVVGPYTCLVESSIICERVRGSNTGSCASATRTILTLANRIKSIRKMDTRKDNRKDERLGMGLFTLQKFQHKTIKILTTLEEFHLHRHIKKRQPIGYGL